MSSPAPPKAAASVILFRDSAGPLEVYMLRRHRKAKFMHSAYVFPGGVQEDTDAGDIRLTAARELLEEAGVLLCRETLTPERADGLRDKLTDDQALPAFAQSEALTLDLESLQYYAHWITPEIEKRRYSATFFVARLPDGQVPSPDNKETTDETWLAPADAVRRAAELRLPPPQVRILADLSTPAAGGWDAVCADAAARTKARHPILPKMLALPAGGMALVLPWDAQYDEAQGEGRPMAPGHPLAIGPSRFVMEDGAWRNVHG